MRSVRAAVYRMVALLAALGVLCAASAGSPQSAECTTGLTPSAAATTATLTFATKGPVLFNYGRSATLSGVLANEAVLAGRSIKLQSVTGAGASWVDTATSSTDPAGRFSFSVAPCSKTTYRAVLADNPNVLTTGMFVVPRIAFSKIGGRSKVRKGRRWFGTCSATTYGNPARRSVVMKGYRLERGKWRHRKTWTSGVMLIGICSPGPPRVCRVDYWLDVKFPRKGKWRVQLATKSNADHAASVGPYKQVRVY